MAILKRNKSSISGLSTDLDALNAAVASEASDRAAVDGQLATLTTTAKGDLVSAINEVKAVGDAATAAAAGTLKAASNLSDVANVATARTNLQVLSSTEVTDAINAAKLALGSNFTVVDLAARDALVGLDTSDRVLVQNDGDAKWAMYQPATIVDGTVTAWTKLADQDALETAISAPSIKASYESNPDTNAYTDADKAKVGFVSVTTAVNLDQAILSDALVQDLTVAPSTTEAPSAAAVADLVTAKTADLGVKAALENAVVTAGAITLAQAPQGGLAGVLNFATVRYVDGGGVAYDAPVSATVVPKVFNVSTDSAGQWDGFTVQVQYLYIV